MRHSQRVVLAPFVAILASSRDSSAATRPHCLRAPPARTRIPSIPTHPDASHRIPASAIRLPVALNHLI
ncbi:hypothetical protein WS81_21225 [Burkholderia sp. MSMB2040]|nr:hypothetical protein WS77_31570 [Burkholderia sp. MSMB0265]KVG89568.1 hypothetical protein WS81_21225 [Burkholderia sp. MSMB2040]